MKRKQKSKQKTKNIYSIAFSFLITIVLIIGITLAVAERIQDIKVSPISVDIGGFAIDEPLHPKIPSKAQVIYPTDYTIPPIINGLAPVISRLPSKEPVVFLGIDDGANKQPFELQLMKDNRIKASLFLAKRFIIGNPDFFKAFVHAGSLIENHTLDHKLLSKISYDEQKAEICGMADYEQQEYGQRPVLFRPPGGDYNLDTQRAAAACGMKAVVMWIAKANGGAMQYQIGHILRAGDIVLMHFRPEFKSDMQAFINAENAAGLHTELLENWLPKSS